ncbi:MAG: methylmalonyl Co-A mutase-associated GTPase MeaB [Candidatus Aminicenantes bacterium]|nr:methylmalonyl Co-A mutase-associated GTPase MeaB [Candidatus Aminicenantes bacterium]
MSSGIKRSQLEIADYTGGVLKNDKTILGRTITLIESSSPNHYEKGRQVLKKLLPHAGESLRIGITGMPGAGKSTFIESLGCFLIEAGHKVAVLTVDPSSSLTKGSILGDKTRMAKLSRRDECFIRPSPTGGTLGGVTRKTRETVLVCEAAGYDVLLIETVGVGQNEITVRSMVDFFLLLMIAGAGDELQAIKKGVIEIADALLINKADGANKAAALSAAAEYSRALKYLIPATKGWQTEAYTCSALEGRGIPEIWAVIEKFEQTTKESGMFAARRNKQAVEWVFTIIEDHLKESFYNDARVKEALPGIEEQILKNEILPTAAAEKLLRVFDSP